MSKEFAAANLTLGQINALVKKLGGYDGAMRFLRGGLVVSEPICRWREERGVIYLKVTSDGTTGPQWIERLEKKGFNLGCRAKGVLCSDGFKPTSGVVYEVAILKGELFRYRLVRYICAEATKRNFVRPNAEVACLIRDSFSDYEIKDMGIVSIIVMHLSIEDPANHLLYFLGASRREEGGNWLSEDYDQFSDGWGREDGFAFMVPQSDK